MLDDRAYMRPEYEPGGSWRPRLPISLWLVIVLAVVFALQQIDNVYFHGAHIADLYLTRDGLARGYVWQLFTFQFLHVGLIHLLFNAFALWCFGRFVEERLGVARFLWLYFLGGAAGGLLQFLLMWKFPEHFGTIAAGASAGISGLVAAFALIEPDATILAYFFLPLRAKYLLYLDAGMELFFTLVPSDGIAHPAHLGGILFAVGYMRWGVNASRVWSEWNPFQRKIRRERMVKAATIHPALSQLRRRPKTEESFDLPSEEFISQQVDPILDKISAHGIQSLTTREREILQAARARMSKR